MFREPTVESFSGLKTEREGLAYVAGYLVKKFGKLILK